MRGLPCMTPQEIFDYKFGWKSNAFLVSFHSDHHLKYVDWCNKNFNKWEWDIIKWTDVYEHTMMFEKQMHAKQFEEFIR